MLLRSGLGDSETESVCGWYLGKFRFMLFDFIVVIPLINVGGRGNGGFYL